MKTSEDLKTSIPNDLAWYYEIIPNKMEDNVLHLDAKISRLSIELQNEIEGILGYPVFLRPHPDAEIDQLLQTTYPRSLSSESANANFGQNKSHYKVSDSE